MNNQHQMSPAQFVETFGPALQGYLEQSYGKTPDTHVCDLLAHTGAFFDATYHSVEALLYASAYTKPVATEEQTTSQE